MAVKERKQPRRQCEKPPKIRTRVPSYKHFKAQLRKQLYADLFNTHESTCIKCSEYTYISMLMNQTVPNTTPQSESELYGYWVVVFFGISMELRFPPTKTVRLPALTWYDGGKDKTKSNSGPTQHNSFASLWVLSCLRVSVFKHVALPDGPKG